MAFDQAYYQRFYENPRTAVSSGAEFRARGGMIAAVVKYLGLPVRSILDAGCGMGQLRAPLLETWPRASYSGYEISEYLCRRFGWMQGELQQLPTRQHYDLVVCYDVLQYLGRADAREAIRRLATVCRGALYFGALTTEDWRHNCDRSRTDSIKNLRSARWYRRELSRHFRSIGCGVWLKRDLELAVWSLDES